MEETITERHLVGIEICDYLLKKMFVYLAMFIMYLANPFLSFRIVVMYLAIIVLFLAKHFKNIKNHIKV